MGLELREVDNGVGVQDGGRDMDALQDPARGQGTSETGRLQVDGRRTPRHIAAYPETAKPSVGPDRISSPTVMSAEVLEDFRTCLVNGGWVTMACSGGEPEER
jgi:hypothetical protein